jgi:hypothetical protein
MSRNIEGIENDEIIYSMSKNFFKQSSHDQDLVMNAILALQNPPPIPPAYKNAAKRMDKLLKKNGFYERRNADPSALTDEQLYAIDQEMVRTRYDANIAGQIFGPITDYQSFVRWTDEYYTLSGDTFPIFSKGPVNAFRDLAPLRLGVEPTLKEGVGWHIQWDLPWTLIDASAGGLYSPDTWHNFKAGELMGRCAGERAWLGTAGEHGINDLGIKGIFNYAGISTEALGADDDNNVTAAGDIDDALRSMLGDLVGVYEPGEIILVSTSGPASELYFHDHTYHGHTEYETIQKKYFDSGLISAWYVTNNLEADTNATNTGQMLLFKMGPSIMKRTVIYPFQKKPMSSKFEDDINFMLLEADIFKIYNTSAVTKSSADVTSTSAGIVQNGLFMQGRTRTGVPRPTNIFAA